MKFKKIISKFIYYIIFRVFSLLPLNRNQLICSNFNGKGFGDNPKYVIDELLKMSDDKIRVYWMISKNIDLPKPIIPVNINSLKFLYIYYTSKVIVSNVRLEPFLYKRKGQIYYQTWHGGIPLKKIEKDVEDKLDIEYVVQAKRDSKMIDIFISNSTFNSHLIKNSFWYHGEILESGYPRNSILFVDNSKYRKKICDLFNIDSKNLIVLYAPTFRNKLVSPILTFDFEMISNNIGKRFGKKVTLIIRKHPSDKTIINNQYVKDVSNYPDMQELMISSDIYISDYSSAMFEFMMMKKPVFLYAPDIIPYFEERGYYMDIHALPFAISESMTNLEMNIRNFDEDDYINRVNGFMSKMEIFDNELSAIIVAKDILNKII